MPRTIPSGWAVGALALVLAISTPSLADEPKDGGLAHHPTSRRDASSRGASNSSASSGGFWISTAGIALALAAFGAISLGARKMRPGGADAGPLKVIGRASLSPRQTVYLLRAGDRVLILGSGGQGPPTLLGEMMPDEIPAATPRRSRDPVAGIGAST